MKKEVAFKVLSTSVLVQPLTLPVGFVLMLATYPLFTGTNSQTVNNIKTASGVAIISMPIISSLVASYYLIK